MTKAVFRPEEILMAAGRIILDPPTAFPELAHLANIEEEDQEQVREEEIYIGPSVEDIRREVEMLRANWDREKEALIESAKAEADSIVHKAEEAAELEAELGRAGAESIKNQSIDEAEKILAKAQEDAQTLLNESREVFESGRKEAEEQGRAEGLEAGYKEGKAEVDRLIERTQIVLQRAQDRRGEILVETEQEIISLVLLISRKIIKVISENQRDVIIANVKQALQKVKTKGNIIIKVNTADLKLTTEHTREFINLVEGVNNLEVMEDPSIDSGGCIIETDFGEIDARIASQLSELEARILQISPMKTKAKPGDEHLGIL